MNPEDNDPIDDDYDTDELTREEPSDDDEAYSDEDDTQEEPSDEGEGDDDTEADEDQSSDSTPEGVKRRFATLTAKRRAAEARVTELEAENTRLREASGMEDPMVYVAVAEKYGILPQITDTKTAKALGEMNNLEGRIDFLRDTLDRMEDREETEIVLQGETFMRADLRQELRRAERHYHDLKDHYGNVGKSLSERTAHLLRLGLAAEKAAQERARKTPVTKKQSAARTAQRETPPRRRTAPRREENPQDRLARIIRSFSAPK